jgi:hypothetical protein
MTRRPVRVALLLLFLAAMSAAAYLFWIAEQEGHSQTVAARTLDSNASLAVGLVADLRSAQQAYVTPGQGPDFWFARTAAITSDLKTRLGSLRQSAAAPKAAAAADDALTVLQDFEQMDARARDDTRGRQITLASDLIYSEGMELTRKLAEAVERARSLDAASREQTAAALQRREKFSLGAAAAASTAIVLLLMPAGSRERDTPITLSRVVPAETKTPSASAADISMVEGWTPARPAPQPAERPAAPDPAPAPAVSAPAALSAEPPKPAISTPRIDLQVVSTLCGDLARVGDTRTLPPLLERIAHVLDASGLIVWVADPDARELAPILTHGYPANLVTRLGVIGRDADNATAAAFRTGLLQTVKADAVSSGAVAAPLVAASGCVGVVAAEVRSGGENQPAILATAGIIAAQLATLVGPPSSRRAEAAG